MCAETLAGISKEDVAEFCDLQGPGKARCGQAKVGGVPSRLQLFLMQCNLVLAMECCFGFLKIPAPEVFLLDFVFKLISHVAR